MHCNRHAENLTLTPVSPNQVDSVEGKDVRIKDLLAALTASSAIFQTARFQE